MLLIDYYLLLGLLIHVAFLALVDWLGYNHLMKYGYDHTLLVLGLLNVAVLFGIYYLVIRPLRRRIVVRKMRRRRVQHEKIY